MGRPRKTSKLRIVRKKYYCADIYLPSGKRTTVGFGTIDEHTEGEVLVAFGKWLDLYLEQPHKVLSYDNPYEAISQILNPTTDVTVGELLEKFHIYISRKFRTEKDTRQHPDFAFINRVRDSLKPYKDWPVQTFGPDELYEVQQALALERLDVLIRPDFISRFSYEQGLRQNRLVAWPGSSLSFDWPEAFDEDGLVLALTLGIGEWSEWGFGRFRVEPDGA